MSSLITLYIYQIPVLIYFSSLTDIPLLIATERNTFDHQKCICFLINLNRKKNKPHVLFYNISFYLYLGLISITAVVVVVVLVLLASVSELAHMTNL